VGGLFFFHPSKTAPQIKLSPVLKRFVNSISLLNHRGLQMQAEVVSTDQMRCPQNEMFM